VVGDGFIGGIHSLSWWLVARLRLCLKVLMTTKKKLPIAAHNCYPRLMTGGTARIDAALRLGFDNIEIDVGWDQNANLLVVSHDAAASAGQNAFALDDYLLPSLERHLTSNPVGMPPSVLTFDLKSDSPDAASALNDFLQSHASWFSKAEKKAGAPIVEGRLTVCLRAPNKTGCLRKCPLSMLAHDVVVFSLDSSAC
jgi:hypothetical protein